MSFEYFNTNGVLTGSIFKKTNIPEMLLLFDRKPLYKVLVIFRNCLTDFSSAIEMPSCQRVGCSCGTTSSPKE